MKSPQDFPKSYTDAVRNKKVNDFANLFDENVRIFDLWDDWSMQGGQNNKAMAADWFSSLNDEYVQTTFSEVQIIENSDLALITCFIRFAGHSADGAQLRFLDERMTVSLRRSPTGDWKVVHQHTSSPVDSQKMTAKLKRA